ncbi:PIN domain-containing protein [Metallococcus carri]|uniref:hypothetical protein n=1 Tax=Metallococcus carri TaxID=1656884 RepID=UPI001A9FBE6C|nr:hypothetical protein [Metallococcus carri]
MPVVEQFVTALTIAEIERGVVQKERSDRRQGQLLRACCRSTWRQRGHWLGFECPSMAPLDDALIGAIAKARGMTVVTRKGSGDEQIPRHLDVQAPTAGPAKSIVAQRFRPLASRP